MLRSSSVGAITVVLGARADTVRTSADLSGTNVVINEDYRRGQLSSLIVGLKGVPPQAEAIILCLVDHPLISADIVDRLIDEFGKTGKQIVLPVFNGRRGHPALFARSLFDEIISAPMDKGARHVVSSNQDKVLDVDVPDRGVLTSIDTPEDYRTYFGAEPQIVSKKP